MAEKQKTLFGIEEPEKIEMSGHTVRIAFDAGVDQTFDYSVPLKLWPVGLGQRVEVPFGRGNKPKIGFCVGIDCSVHVTGKSFKIKAINDVIDKKPLLNSKLLELAEWISDYYICPLGQVIAAMVPAAVKKGSGLIHKKYLYLDILDAKGNLDGEKLENVKISLKRAKKQLEVVSYLESCNAFNEDKAIEQSQIQEECHTTSSIVRKLLESKVVRAVKREVIRSLPAVPEEFIVKSKKDIVLNEQQQTALDHINSEIDSGKFGVSLLHGVTDSGKTEVYIRAIAHAISNGKKAIVLLPEIALTTQTLRRFSARFERLAVLHSSLTDSQRNSQWQKIASGQADVVIGARSAIFAPLDSVGVVVVDEEHEGTYKQDIVPRYNGRDVAIKRAHLDGGHCILGSATPSLETLHNCDTKKHFEHLKLTKRVMDLPMPEMKCVDLSQQSGDPFENLISEKLELELHNVLAKKEQAILLLNRRGYSNFVYCPSCKYILHCRNCDISLTFHRHDFEHEHENHAMTRYKGKGYAVCHYCGSKTLVPVQCPICRHSFTMSGVGVQKLEEQLAMKFPQAKVRRIDSDSMRSDDYYDLLKDFAEGKIDILAGTQILAKGLHFPNVTLVGVINADSAMAVSDFRANEKAFQLISQVAGRTGRGEKGGLVIVQTMKPDQPALKFAMRNDFDGFVNIEMFMREKCKLPPFTRMALILLRGENHQRLENAAKTVTDTVHNIIKSAGFDITVRGPVASPIPRLNRMYRMQLLLISDNPVVMSKFFKIFRNQPQIKGGIKILFDIDPVF